MHCAHLFCSTFRNLIQTDCFQVRDASQTGHSNTVINSCDVVCLAQVREWRTNRCWWTSPCQLSPRHHWREVPSQVSPSTETCPSGESMFTVTSVFCRSTSLPLSYFLCCCIFSHCLSVVIRAQQTPTSRRSWSHPTRKMLSSSRSSWDRRGDQR